MTKKVDSSADKLHRYVVTTIGGLEEVVLDELRNELGLVKQIRTEKGKRHGRRLYQLPPTSLECASRYSVGKLSHEAPW